MTSNKDLVTLCDTWEKFKRERDVTALADFLISQIKAPVLIVNPVVGCNLRCLHCSYECDPEPKEAVEIDVLKQVISQAKELGVKRCTILGKEPLLGFEKRTGPLLNHMTKEEMPFGMVTNGTLVKDNITSLRRHRFWYIDVSIDGTKGFHDRNRGEGNYEKAAEGLITLRDEKIAEKLFVSATAMSYNFKDLPHMVRDFIKKGIVDFSIGLYAYTGTNPSEWKLRAPMLPGFLEELCETSYDANEVIVDIHSHVARFWDYLVEKGIIDSAGVQHGEKDNMFYQIPGSNVFLRNNLLTTGPWNTLMITADGNCLTDYEDASRKNWRAYSIGNIATTPLREILTKIPEECTRFARKLDQLIKRDLNNQSGLVPVTLRQTE